MENARYSNPVYVPVYERGLRRVLEIDGDLLAFIGTSDREVAYWRPGVGYWGSIWNADTIYKTEEAAWKYWYRDPISPEEHFIVERRPRACQTEKQ